MSEVVSPTQEGKCPIIIPEAFNPELNRDLREWVSAHLGPEPSYDASLQPEIDQYGYPQFRTGVITVNKWQEILMMHEAKVQVRKIKDQARKSELLAKGKDPNDWVVGDGGWNLPSGRLRHGESFEEGGLREAREESGWKVILRRCLFVRQTDTYFMPVFLATPEYGPRTYSTEETLEIGWFSSARIRAMCDEGLLRSPEFVTDALNALERVH